MNSVLIIIDSLDLWEPYYHSDSVITAIQYLQREELSQDPHLVINLCSDLSYNSEGYYCSLLAQARDHKVIPKVETLNKFDNSITMKLDSAMSRLLRFDKSALFEKECDCSHHLDLFFGKCEDPKYERLGRFFFDLYPCPLMRVSFSGPQRAEICNIRLLSLTELDDRQQDLFAGSLDLFNKKVWRQPRSKKPARYDLAIFYDPEELLPPSNKSALKLFLNEARKMNVNAELLTADDASRLMEFDALFIRQTTAVNHITYQLAQKAQQADMVVIDDPASIVCCTNKVYLKELMDRSAIPAPRSILLFREKIPSYEEVSEYLGRTMVMKIPDGSFSIGVSLVSSDKEYIALQEALFQHSSVLLIQEFMPTEFDWRIGVLNGECIYACKYYMARGHWQIYQHKASGLTKSGKSETVPVHQVPSQVTRIAKKVSAAIGKGLYGVDIKDVDGQAVVIEVNDNPSIDHGVEDKILGSELYRIILREFIARLNKKRRA
ncbi:glutathione synthase/ribosomal protein S6 modification enzyme (glutaminyl transferase) [Desulfocapsa sulfexigens DSM 10523]|uniref:Glutathione synthase/ribosomal protein S6 modification enzyme (Glutaminyl transferase) n=1 Tax=Desulfocapsa sulfexigens (strain DSM 10523 / SB164P1) TaxID=1167006 RepID=M1PL05_DESSD|nr:RimK family protein [Desulfocapsa sulfexigens]AGF77161.1 glutathione synthase/ribosomal protein S6 modification enzyme (glutaminyl transferase) [Desulfocapsa sulfexigens DSM 10523]